MTTVDPSRPGSSYAPFLEGSLRMISAAANMPYEIVAKNFFRTTFSSGKLAVNDGKMGFAMRRSTLIDAGLKPIYRRVVHDRVFADEVAGTIPIEDYIKNPDAYSRHKYQAKDMGEIDETKAMNAFKTGNEQGIINKADYHDERGQDWESQEDQRRLEQMREVDDRLAVEKYEMEQRQKLGLPMPVDPNDPNDPGQPDDKNNASGSGDTNAAEQDKSETNESSQAAA